MLEARPIVTDEDGVILGGNMRFEALKALGYKEIPAAWVKTLTGLTDEQKREFLIKDNVGFGSWDWDILANEWESEILTDWGLDLNIDEINAKVDKAEENEEIELPQSVQLLPPKEYILIMAEPNSIEWEEIKEKLQLQIVRRGGYKKGSIFDKPSMERVIN